MDVPTIEMDPGTARVKAAHYEGVRASDPELEAARRAYTRLEKGDRLIDIRAALRTGGVDEEGMPRLAIARADRRFVTYDGPSPYDQTAAFDASSIAGADIRTPTLYLHFDGIFPAPERRRGSIRVVKGTRRTWSNRRAPMHWSRQCHGVAQVPMVPPEVERRRSVLKDRFILWEVEEWAEPKNFRPPLPPGDPYLLEHFEGDLYAIVGEWDLTPLEQAIVGGRDLE